MKRNLNKAFTLIELLAVIVILAIIALIATPIILGIVEDARKDSFERSVELVISTTDLDVASKNIQDGYMYEITDGTIPNLEIGIKNIEGMNGTIVYDKEGKEQYAIHNGKYCVMKTEGMDKAQISDYEEGSCKLVVTTESKYFTYEETVIYKIIDKEACQTFFVQMGNPSEEATTVCNNEPNEFLNGMTLTELLASGDGEAQYVAIKLIDVNAISYTGTEYELVDTTTCQTVFEDVAGSTTEEMVKLCNNEVVNGNTFPELIRTLPKEWLEQFIEKGAVRIKNAPLEITGYSEEGPKNVIIPSTIDGNTVVSIGSMAFDDKDLTSVDIPDTVTDIAEYAFSNNQIANIYLSENLEYIGESAFSNNQITNLSIPDSVTHIDNFAFSNNQITNVEISNTNKLQIVEDSAFCENSISESSEAYQILYQLNNSAFICGK